jgi:hypothetical protein
MKYILKDVDQFDGHLSRIKIESEITNVEHKFMCRLDCLRTKCLSCLLFSHIWASCEILKYIISCEVVALRKKIVERPERN